MPPVTLNLLILNVLIWALTALFPSLDATLAKFCALHYFTSDYFNVGQIVSYMFLHANFMHLFFNMFTLVMFGGIIERAMESKRFLFYYLTCGIVAALVQEGVWAMMMHGEQQRYVTAIVDQFATSYGVSFTEAMQHVPADTLRMLESQVTNAYITVGASGAIYGILLAFAMLFPNQPMYLMFIPVPVKAKWMVLGFFLIELFFGIGNNPSDNVAHFAHLGGMIGGVFLILYWKKKGIFNNRWFF